MNRKSLNENTGVRETTGAELASPLFASLRQETLISRLAQEMRYALYELSQRPSAYLKTAFFPPSIRQWLPVRLAREIASEISHPLAFISGTLSIDKSDARYYARVLSVVAVVFLIQVGIGSYLIYTAVISPFSSFRLVSKPYRQLEEVVMLKSLPNPERRIRPASEAQPMTLEEIEERERKRREEAARRERRRAEREKAERERIAREHAEREKTEREKAEKEKAAQQAASQPATEQSKPTKASATEFGEINEAPLKEIVGKVYQQYKAGGLDIDVMNFTVMAAFEIEPDGSLSQVRIIESSGSKIIDMQARAILHAISESHALSPIADLTSNTIRLEMTEKVVQLTIMGFAPSETEAKNKASNLNLVLSIARMAQQSKSPDTAELLSMVNIISDNKRIYAKMMTSRERASQMMRARFGGSQ